MTSSNTQGEFTWFYKDFLLSFLCFPLYFIALFDSCSFFSLHQIVRSKTSIAINITRLLHLMGAWSIITIPRKLIIFRRWLHGYSITTYCNKYNYGESFIRRKKNFYLEGSYKAALKYLISGLQRCFSVVKINNDSRRVKVCIKTIKKSTFRMDRQVPII